MNMSRREVIAALATLPLGSQLLASVEKQERDPRYITLDFESSATTHMVFDAKDRMSKAEATAVKTHVSDLRHLEGIDRTKSGWNTIIYGAELALTLKTPYDLSKSVVPLIFFEVYEQNTFRMIVRDGRTNVPLWHASVEAQSLKNSYAHGIIVSVCGFRVRAVSRNLDEPFPDVIFSK